MDNIFRKQIEPLDIIRDYQDKEPPNNWKPPEQPNNWKPPEQPNNWKPPEPPNDWEPPEQPNNWKPPEPPNNWESPEPPNDWESLEPLNDWKPPEPPNDWESLESPNDWKPPEPPNDWESLEPPNDWKPPELPNDWEPPEVIKPSVSSSKIPAEAYVKTIPQEAFYKEELYRRICCVNVNDFRRGQIIEAFGERAKQLGGVSLRRYYEKQLKTYLSMMKKGKRDKICISGSVEGMTNYTDLPEGIVNLYCGKLWMATDEGIFFLGGDEPFLICKQPILIVAVLKSEDTGEEKIKLLFKHDGEWTETICEKDILASAQKITTLHKIGISVTSKNAKYMVAVLQDMEDYSRERHLIPVIKMLYKLGWNDAKSVFYPYTEENVGYDDKYGLPGLGKALQEKGNREAWYQKYTPMRKIPMVQFLAAASLSAPIVGMLNLDGFTACLYGESRGGKSVANKIVCSLWAGSERKDGFIFSANNTSNAMDDILGTYGSIPVTLEDLNNMSEEDRKRIPQELAMKVSNGIGKGRMTKDGKLSLIQVWYTVACMTSESRMTKDFRNAGSYNRVVQMEGATRADCPFTKNDMNVGEIQDFFENNHGYGSRDFIKALIEIGKKNLSTMLYEIRKQVSEKAREQGKAGGQELPIAVMLLADQIAEEYLFHDEVKISIDEAVSWMSAEDTVNQNMRFYDTLMDFVVQHSGNFENWRMSGGSNVAYYGKYDEKKNQISILPSVLKNLADEHGVDYLMFVKYLGNHGLLIKDKKGNDTRPVYCKWLQGKSKRLYVIAMPEQEKPEDDSEEESKEDAETAGGCE